MFKMKLGRNIWISLIIILLFSMFLSTTICIFSQERRNVDFSDSCYLQWVNKVNELCNEPLDFKENAIVPKNVVFWEYDGLYSKSNNLAINIHMDFQKKSIKIEELKKNSFNQNCIILEGFSISYNNLCNPPLAALQLFDEKKLVGQVVFRQISASSLILEGKTKEWMDYLKSSESKTCSIGEYKDYFSHTDKDNIVLEKAEGNKAVSSVLIRLAPPYSELILRFIYIPLPPNCVITTSKFYQELFFIEQKKYLEMTR